MKATFTPRIVGGRIDLCQSLPLETPLTVSLDPSSACNFKCAFCYHSGKKKIPAQLMEFELFKKCIDDLKQFPDIIKTVRLYKEGEPLLNKNIADMVKYAKNSPKVGRVDFTTNGMFLNENLGIRLAGAGLDRIIVSIEGLNDDDYYKITGTRVSFDVIRQQMKSFYKNRGNCILHIKTTDVCVPECNRDKFFNIFGDICDEIFIEQVSPFWPEFDISNIKSKFDKNTHGESIKEIEVCPSIFSAMVINADGSADICFADWRRRVVLGNAKSESLYDIWHGDKINAIRKLHLEKGRKYHILCAKCDCPDFTSVDDIDDAREIILKKFNWRYGNGQ